MERKVGPCRVSKDVVLVARTADGDGGVVAWKRGAVFATYGGLVTLNSPFWRPRLALPSLRVSHRLIR
jgi:hypothetical protein